MRLTWANEGWLACRPQVKRSLPTRSGGVVPCRSPGGRARVRRPGQRFQLGSTSAMARPSSSSSVTSSRSRRWLSNQGRSRRAGRRTGSGFRSCRFSCGSTGGRGRAAAGGRRGSGSRGVRSGHPVGEGAGQGEAAAIAAEQNGGYFGSGYGPGPITQSDLVAGRCVGRSTAVPRRSCWCPPGIRRRFPPGGTAAFEACQRGRKAMPGPTAGRSGLMQATTTAPSPCGGALAGRRTDSSGQDQDQLGRRELRRMGSVAMPVTSRSTILVRAVRLPPLTPPPVTTSCSRRAAGTDHGRWVRVRAGRAEPAPAAHMGV